VQRYYNSRLQCEICKVVADIVLRILQEFFIFYIFLQIRDGSDNTLLVEYQLSRNIAFAATYLR